MHTGQKKNVWHSQLVKETSLVSLSDGNLKSRSQPEIETMEGGVLFVKQSAHNLFTKEAKTKQGRDKLRDLSVSVIISWEEPDPQQQGRFKLWA